VGIVGGAAGAWTVARRKEPGLILEIEDRFFVQAAVVEAIAARAARVRRQQEHRRGPARPPGRPAVPLAEFSADVPRHGVLYLVSLQAEERRRRLYATC
jgi:hypothetical protein